MSDAASWTPFGGLARSLPAEGEGVRLAALPTPSAFLLQADPGDAAWREAVAAAVGLTPSVGAGAVARSGADRRCICLGPDSWLLLGVEEQRALSALESGSARFGHAAVVEVTEARAWLALEGPQAAATLAKLTTLDLDAAAFPAGRAYGARLGPLACLIERPRLDAFVIAGPTSSAEYLAGMLLRALA